ncbi:ATP-binding protein [Cohnella sp. GCM10020058]|uniref:ATP-binding protein n=1 Tax=Cohnella sp. GCM10020058 TaxID=3317330 RepID=UPI00362AFBA3
MTEGKSYPVHLLDSSPEIKADYFRKFTVLHPALKTAFLKLFDLVSNPGNTSIILVYGPSGVGKTTLYLNTMKKIIEDEWSSLEKDPGKIPVAGIEALAPENGQFDWKEFYIRSLESLDEPLIDKKVDYEKKYQDSTKVVKEDRNRHLRRSLENALHFRRPRAFMIDEAQHFTKMASGKQLKNQMDTIKSLASQSRVPYVLVGTYELLPFRNLSGQLSRRGADIHLHRYRAEQPDELKSFINVLWTFQKNLPLEIEPQIVDFYEYFYERTIGCVGILKDWLYRSYKAKIMDNPKTMDLDDFKPFAHSVDQCLHMAREAREGELRLEERLEKQEELARLLGIAEMNLPEEKQPPKKKGRKVGQRKPKRDAVGDIQNVQ